MPPCCAAWVIRLAALLALVASPAGFALADPTRPVADAPASIAELTAGMERRDGLFVTYLDRAQARLWLELPAPADGGDESARCLYIEGIETGVGSNPIGLDRGQIGGARLVTFRRIGPRVLLEEQNTRFRALTDDEPERRAVQESFATSVLWAAPVAAEDPDGRFLVDLTPLLVRDAHATVQRLRGAGQGDYSLDADRSVLDPDACPAFPDNLEFAAILTFGSSNPGGEVRATAPTAESVTLRQHQSFVRLPPEGYEPREFDPRAGAFALEFRDYAADLGAPTERRWVIRHRLKRIDASAERGPVQSPIVYYVDPGAPVAIRSALLDGARWWAQAFEAAGFVDAFRVEVLPADAHPLDVRYNVIQWVHRATRGWSYGNAVVDPRTGEIIKGHVTLGSLRVRHDELIFTALLGADGVRSGAADDPVQLALARIRQLSAHEVGHTLGFGHNFAASAAGRASVMDYPAPWVRLADGRLDVAQAYAAGIGEWDKLAVRHAYAQFQPGTNETAALEAILQNGLARGLIFLTDEDARPLGGAHPQASLWDNGDDPVAELERVLAVRRVALENFGEHNVATGAPLSKLEEALGIVYFYHRFQLEAAAKVVGGLDYRYALRGDGQPPPTPLTPDRQTRALDVIMTALAPAALDLPERVLALLPPRPSGIAATAEQFQSGATAPAFDSLGAAASAADLVFSALLNGQRCARLVDFHRRDAAQPGLPAVIDRLIAAAFESGPDDTARLAAIRRRVQDVLTTRLIGLAREAPTPEVAAEAEAALLRVAERLKQSPAAGGADPGELAHRVHLASVIRRFLERTSEPAAAPAGPPDAPAGSPIGGRPSTAAGPDWGSCSLDP